MLRKTLLILSDERDAWRSSSRTKRHARPDSSSSRRPSSSRSDLPGRPRLCWSPWSGRSLALAFLPRGPRSPPPADLLVSGPLTFLVLLAPEAVVPASMAVRVTFTAAPGAMPTATMELTATPPTMAMAAQAMPTAMDRGDTATGAIWRLCLQQF